MKRKRDYHAKNLEQYIQKNIRVSKRNFKRAEDQCKKKDEIDRAIVRGSEIECPKCKSLDCDIYGKDKYDNELLICIECQNVWKVDELPKEIKSHFESLKSLLQSRGDE
jgi:hypothetical protein